MLLISIFVCSLVSTSIEIEDIENFPKARKFKVVSIPPCSPKTGIDISESLTFHCNAYCCVAFINDQRPWVDARDFCWKGSGKLIQFDTMDDIDVASTALAQHKKCYWMGLNDREIEGEYVWLDGSRSGLIDMLPESMRTDPSIFREQNDCEAFCSTPGEDVWRWHSQRCTMVYYFICQFEKGAAPTTTSQPTAPKLNLITPPITTTTTTYPITATTTTASTSTSSAIVTTTSPLTKKKRRTYQGKKKRSGVFRNVKSTVVNPYLLSEPSYSPFSWSATHCCMTCLSKGDCTLANFGMIHGKSECRLYAGDLETALEGGAQSKDGWALYIVD